MTITQFRTFVNHLDENRAWVVEKMEEIRSANDALRQRSQYFEEEYDKAASELSDKESELEDALKELTDLRQQLDEV